MMKRIFLCFCFLALATTMFADDHRVSLSQAQTEAKAFMQSLGVTFRAKAPRRSAVKVDADTVYAPYYIVPGQQGFVVVSGDRRIAPILGYATRGTISPDSLPCNVRAWLDGYTESLRSLDASPALRTPVALRTFYSPSHSVATGRGPGGEALRGPGGEAVSPLLHTAWSQTAPFNDQAPMYNGQHCVAGCVATAMAQLIAYHQSPSTIKAIPAYTSNSRVGTLDALPATTLDWTAINAGSGEAYNTEVAKLTRYCGQAVRMDYGTSSGAYSELVASSLVNYFGYPDQLCIARRQWYSVAEWDSLLITELAAHRPLYYTASSKTESHAFIIDGYDGNGLYHVNWGWGGYCDGYFRISVLAPHDPSGLASSPQSDGFASRQWALTLAAPTTIAPPAPSVSCTALSVNGNKVTMTLANLRRSDITVVPALTEIDYHGDFEIADTAAMVQLPGIDLGGSIHPVTVAPIDLSHTLQGKCRLWPVYRVGNGDWQRCGNENYYIEVVVANDGSMTFTRHPAPNLSASLKTKGSLTLGSSATVDATVSNRGDEYSGMLYGFLGTGGALENKLSTTVAIPASGSEHVLMSFFPPEAGTYRALLSTDASHSNVIGETSFTITSTQTQPEALRLDDAGVVVSSGYAAVTFKLTNGSTELYGRPLHIVLHNRETGVDTRTYDITGVCLQPGASRTWTISFTGLPDDGVYTFDIYAYTYASGTNQTLVGSVEVNMPKANVNRNRLVLTATAGGYISYLSSNITDGSRTFDVAQGNNVKLTIHANDDSKLQAVTLDDTDITSQLSATGTYTLTSIAADHTVKASFIPKPTYTVALSAMGNGTMGWGTTTLRDDSTTATIVDGNRLALSLTPDRGYELQQLLVNGKDCAPDVYNGSYVINAVSSNLDIRATFARIVTATVLIRQNSRGVVSLSLVKGRRCRFRVSPDAGRSVASVTVDGQALSPIAGTTDIYEFTPTSSGTRLTVTFQ